MTESSLDTLARWEDAGAGWRLAHYAEGTAVIELLACTGEPVDVLRSDDPGLRRYLKTRRSSLEPVPPQCPEGRG